MNRSEQTPPSRLRRFASRDGAFNATPARIVFGLDSSTAVHDEVRHLDRRRALVISTPGRRAMAEEIAAALGDLSVGVLPTAVSQVPIELTRAGRKAATEMGADCIVSIGGGASIGLAKGISLELGLPIINIPTTYSGSEMTAFCGITIDGVKIMHEHLNMLAHTVIYDPRLSLGLPRASSAASALNALAHCVDGIYVTSSSPIHQLTAIEGAKVVVNGIRAVWDNPSSLEARSELLYGAYLAGAALAGGFALQHGLAHTLGGSYNVPHGNAHAVVLPYVAAYNSAFARDGVDAVAASLGSESLSGTIHDLLHELELPARLPDVGIGTEDLDRIVGITVETDNGLNPGPVTHEAVRGIVDAAFIGARP
ncbi:iron-containing alcohol dehydrogenase [Billgrantia endophytica]|nr:iron-containing alcohol dehydrogenase [Halomonas endophytica]